MRSTSPAAFKYTSLLVAKHNYSLSVSAGFFCSRIVTIQQNRNPLEGFFAIFQSIEFTTPLRMLLRFLSLILLSGILLFGGTFSAFGQSEPNYRIYLKSRVFTPEPNAAAWEDLLSTPYVQADGLFYLQFEQVPTTAEKAELANAGLQLVHYLPKNTFLARLTGSTPVPQLVNLLHQTDARALLEPKLTDKLDHRLLAGSLPGWAVGNQGDIRVQVRFADDISLAEGQRALQNAGYQPRPVEHLSRSVEVTVPVNELVVGLADIPQVLYIEPIEPPALKENFKARGMHRVSNLQTGGLTYDGTGINVIVDDDGVIGEHIDFEGRLIDRTPGSNGGDHGDHCAGTVLAAGNLDPLGQGMAPNADLYVYDYPDGINDINNAYPNDSVLIVSASYSNGCNAGYTSWSEEIDNNIRMMPSLMHVFSAGNSGSSSCGFISDWYNITGGHKVGKNCLAVGNITNDEDIAGSSSRGPSRDGRIKPEVCALGTGVYSTEEDNTYGFKTGTSMACPGVAGTFAVLQEAYHDIYGNIPPSNIIKAILMNAADDRGNPGPDYKYGFGRINALRSLETLQDGRFLVDSLVQGQSQQHTISVPAGAQELRVMVYWHDYEGTPNAGLALVNDIDMVVASPSGTNYNPWTLDTLPSGAALDANATRNPDHLNNMEQVTLSNPSAGTYTIDLDAFAIPQGPQTYVLTWEVIQDPLTLTYPAGGDAFVPNEDVGIRWNAFGGSGNFTLEYSLDNGSTWQNAGTANANERFFDWTVPNAATGNARFRISSGGVTSTSPTFSIIEAPQNLTITQVCPSSITLDWDPVPNATGYDIFMLGNKYMEVVGNASISEFTLNNFNYTQNTWFSVRATGPSGAIGRRAYAVEHDGNLVNCSISTDLALNSLSPYFTGPMPECLANSSPITAEVENTGSSVVNSFDLSFSFNGQPPVTETFNTSVAPGATETVTFTQAVPSLTGGQDEIVVWADFTGDQNPWNDTLTVTPTEVPSPNLGSGFVEDFESFSPCGTAMNCGIEVCPLGNGWINVTNGASDDIDWRVDSDGTPSNGTGPDEDFLPGTTSGQYIYTEASGGCEGQTAELISPCIDLNNTPSGQLKWAYHMDGGDMGSLSIDVKVGNQPWMTGVWSVSGDQGPNWEQDSLDLSPYLGNTIVIRFVGVTGNDFESDIALDAIQLDIPSAEFSADNLAPCPQQTVQFTDETDFAVTNWQWNFSPNTVTYQGGTNANSQNPQVSFNQPGFYTVELIAGSGTVNDTVVKVNYIDATGGQSLPYLEVFSTNIPAEMQVENPDNDVTWVWEDNVTQSDGTDGGVVRINNYSYNENGEEDYLVLPKLDFGALTDANLSFDVAYRRYSSNYSDGMRVEVSTDCGQSFTQVYFEEGTDLATGPDETSDFTPASASDWRNDTVDLTPYVGNNSLIIRFVNVNGYGNRLHLDNINVVSSTPALSTGGVGNSSFCPGEAITVPWNLQNGSVNPGNVFTAELSDANGSFASPTVLANAVPSTAASGSITTNIPAGTPAGTGYRVRVVASSPGITGTDNGQNLSVAESPEILLQALNAPSCSGNDGSITVAAQSGTQPYNFTWQPGGATGNSQSNLGAGIYTIVVADANSCTDTLEQTLVNPQAVDFDLQVTDASCATCADGEILPINLQGTSPYAYQWAHGPTNPNLVGLMPGWYTLTITDDNNCSHTDSAEVSFTTTVGNLAANGFEARVFPNPFDQAITLMLTAQAPGNMQLELRDATGKRVWQTSVQVRGNGVQQEFALPVQELSAGVYLLRMQNANSSHTLRLLKR